MPNLGVTFLLCTFAYRPVRYVVYAFVFADGVPDLPLGALVMCFVELRIVRLVVNKGAP